MKASITWFGMIIASALLAPYFFFATVILGVICTCISECNRVNFNYEDDIR